MLLGSKGVSVPKTAQRLEALRTTTRSLEFLEPVADTDIHGFLKNERENAILSVIEETKKNSFAMVDKLHWETMFNDWEVEKQKILQVCVLLICYFRFGSIINNLLRFCQEMKYDFGPYLVFTKLSKGF